jgi:prevent-host-death family protein
MRRMTTSELRKDISEAVNRVAYAGDRIALQRSGKDVAVIVSVEDYELLSEIENRLDLDAVRKSLAEGGENISWEELKKELDL